jgi:hypothetical protein
VALPARSNLFQDVVAIIQRHMADGAEVEESAMLEDDRTGAKREVDVVIRSMVAGHEVVVSVEASATGRAASVEWVERMVGKHGRLETSKLVLVSESGFTNEARKVANAQGAAALAPEDLAEGDPEFRVVNSLKSIWPKVVSLTPRQVGVGVARPEGKSEGWFEVTEDLPVALDDGQRLGTLIEAASATLKGNMRRIVDQIELVNIDFDMDSQFVVELGPWSVTLDGEERRICYVHNADSDEPELHPIEKLVIHGDASIRIAEVELTHRRLGDVMYAFGQGQIGDQATLLVATETSAGGRLTLRVDPPAGE